MSELRQRVADARGDVDAFIELDTGLPGHFPDPAEISERLTAAGRHREALYWLRRRLEALRQAAAYGGPLPRHRASDPAANRRQRVEIRVLEAPGERAEARALRWELFEERGRRQLARASRRSARFRRRGRARRRFCAGLETLLVYAALRFLVQWPRLDLAERLVVKRRAQWNGRRM